MQTSQKSVQLINKLFNIQPSEWPRVSLMFLMMAVTNAVAIWGATISYAAFLQQIGIDALPWILVLGAILSTVAVAIYSAFADRIANDRLLMAIYGINAFGVVIGLILLWFGSPLAYPLLYLFDLALTGVFNAHFVTYVNGYYDTQAAKRVLPVVIAGARVGGIVAGLSMSLLTAWFDPGAIIFIWFLGYVAMMILIWVTPYLLKQDQTKDTHALYSTTDSAKQTPSYLENIREGFRYTSQSAFLRWMAVGTFFLMVLMALIEYLSSKLLLETFGTEEAFANYLALLLGVANLIVLPILMFGISRLIARIGVGNASMLFPAGSLLISGSMVFWPGLVTASLGYLDRTALRVAFQFPITNLLYNAVPLRVKGRARAFVGGLIDPVGSLVGGLILLLPLVAVAWFVPALIGVLAVVYLVSAWFIRQQYGRALLKLLEQQDFSALFSQDASTLTVADPTVLNQLRQKLERSTSPEFTLFMAQLISQMGGKNAVPILSEVVKTAGEGRTRAAICAVLTANNARGEEVRELYVSLLSDPEATVRESAIGGLEQLADSGDPQFVEHMLMMVQDPDINVRVRALLALAHGGNFYRQPRAVQVLEQILASEDAHQRAYGVRVLGGIGYHRSIRDLTEYLSDPADEVRLAAVTAIEELSQQKLPQLQTSGSDIPELIITEICSLSQDPVEQVRRTALIVLGRLGTPQDYQAMVDGLTDPSPQVRTIAADMLVQIGQEAIPMVQPNLDSSDPQRRKMAAVVLSRINRREFSLLIDAHINENLLTIYQNYTHLEAVQVYHNYRAVAVLQSTLRDQNEELTDEIFYLLTAIHQAKTIKTITETLESNAANVRANAVEALETLTSPDTARLIAPLFQPDLPPSQYLLLGKEIWGISDPDPVVTIGQLSTSELPWLRILTIFALGEIGADLRPTPAAPLQVEMETPVEEQPEPPKERKTRRKRPADLLGVLDKLGNSEETQQRKPRRSPMELLGALTGDIDQPDVKDTLSDPQHVSLAKTADTPLTLPEIEAMIDQAVNDPVSNVQFAAQAARRMLNGQYNLSLGQKEDHMLSVVEKIIFLKEVPFFEGMTVNQLEVLATVCEEEFFAEDTLIFNEGDDGGSMYVIVSGKVAIERQGPRKGSTVRLATLESHQYFGEMTLFDNSPRSALALAGQDTLTLSLRREPLIALARQYPDLSLELINVLSQRLREANTRIAELTRSRPRELQKLFDKLD